MKGINKNLTVLFAVILLSVFAFSFFSYSNRFAVQMNPQERGGGNNVQKAPEEEAPEEVEKIVLAAVGDIMLSRNVEQKMIAKSDWKYPFLQTAAITSAADITFGNLETTILPGNVIQSGSFTFRTDPKAIEGLQLAGFDVLSLANNHMLNFGRNGLEKTLQNLDAAGIGRSGGGLSEEEIYRPVVKEVKGTRIGFLSYSYAKDQSFDKSGQIYGTAYMDAARMKVQVAELRKDVDVVVVSMHAGAEYETSPHPSQINFAHSAVDAGADIVIGHHPHVVQTFEKYNEGYIIYSLGNFVFDQMWSEETRLGAIALIEIEENKISKIGFVPVKIFDYAQPQLLEGEQAEMILKRLEMKEID